MNLLLSSSYTLIKIYLNFPVSISTSGISSILGIQNEIRLIKSRAQVDDRQIDMGHTHNPHENKIKTMPSSVGNLLLPMKNQIINAFKMCA